MQIPKLDKIVINMGLGDAKDNAKAIETRLPSLRPSPVRSRWSTKAKKSVANFKLRAGMNVGAKVTLRGDRMYEFADKLVSICSPRVRDFRGVSAKAFDGRGNYSLGVREQLIFPEIEYDKVEKIRGMDIVFVTTANTDEEAKELLACWACPSQLSKEEIKVAKTSMNLKQQRAAKFSTRAYTRCRICGRPHSVLQQVRHLPYLLP